MNSLFYLARRFKTATALNLLGLTVAFAAFYLFMTQVLYNVGYNRSFPDAEHILRVEAKMNQDSPWGTHCNRPLLEYMIQMPEVESGTIASFEYLISRPAISSLWKTRSLERKLMSCTRIFSR